MKWGRTPNIKQDKSGVHYRVQECMIVYVVSLLDATRFNLYVNFVHAIHFNKLIQIKRYKNLN